jgi:hypothetical protein
MYSTWPVFARSSRISGARTFSGARYLIGCPVPNQRRRDTRASCPIWPVGFAEIKNKICGPRGLVESAFGKSDAVRRASKVGAGDDVRRRRMCGRVGGAGVRRHPLEQVCSTAGDGK